MVFNNHSTRDRATICYLLAVGYQTFRALWRAKYQTGLPPINRSGIDVGILDKRGMRNAKEETHSRENHQQLREGEVIIASGSTVVETARCLKQPETEKSRLKRAGAELTLDNQILKEAVEGNF